MASGKGIAKQEVDTKVTEVDAEDWHLDPDQRREVSFGTNGLLGVLFLRRHGPTATRPTATINDR